jgi:hypothetical protein
VQVSFFGGLSLGQVEMPEPTTEGGPPVASLIDMGGMKAAVITQRAEARDYLDIHAMMGAGLGLPHMLAAAEIIYGSKFNPLVSLKALAYHDDMALTQLTLGARRDMARAVKGVDLQSLPILTPFRRALG